jgi:hypothetical protein
MCCGADDDDDDDDDYLRTHDWWSMESIFVQVLSRTESQDSSERIAFPILLSWFLCCLCSDPRPAWYSVAFSLLHLCFAESCKWVPVVCAEHSITNHGQRIAKTLYMYGVLVLLSAESSVTIVGLWEFITYDSLLGILHHNPASCYSS